MIERLDLAKPSLTSPSYSAFSASSMRLLPKWGGFGGKTGGILALYMIENETPFVAAPRLTRSWVNTSDAMVSTYSDTPEPAAEGARQPHPGWGHVWELISRGA